MNCVEDVVGIRNSMEVPIALNAVKCLGPHAEAKKDAKSATQKHHPGELSSHHGILSSHTHRLTGAICQTEQGIRYIPLAVCLLVALRD